MTVFALGDSLLQNNIIVTSSYVIPTEARPDYTVFCNFPAANDGYTITLPQPVLGRKIVIKDIAGTALTDNITIHRYGSEQIEGINTDFVLGTNFQTITLHADGTNWWIVKAPSQITPLYIPDPSNIVITLAQSLILYYVVSGILSASFTIDFNGFLGVWQLDTSQVTFGGHHINIVNGTTTVQITTNNIFTVSLPVANVLTIK